MITATNMLLYLKLFHLQVESYYAHIFGMVIAIIQNADFRTDLSKMEDMPC